MERERASFAEWALAVVAASTMAVSYVDRQTLAVLAPTVCQVLDISPRGFALLLNAFAIAYLVGAPMAGRLVDLLGARRGLLGAVLAWTFVAALHALVPSFAVLLALRIALGLAESPSFPGAVQTVQRALPVRQRGLGFGILFCGSSIGAAIAAPLADFLCKRYGFRPAFVGTSIAGLIWVPAWIAVAFNDRARNLLDVAKADEPRAVDAEKQAPATRRARPRAPRSLLADAGDPPAHRRRRRERALPQPDDGLGPEVPRPGSRAEAGAVRLARLLPADHLRRRLDLVRPRGEHASVTLGARCRGRCSRSRLR